MDADEFRAALARMKLKQTGDGGAEWFLGTSPRQVRRWASGGRPIPDAVAILLRLMLAQRLKPEAVRKQYGAPRASGSTERKTRGT